ncbi:MAG: hypothetical protein ACUVRG_09630 [Ignavibacterium sp.]|uniref:hypothetical protein n=1 Tax=Ignavibacterium sp. TaxID=2651167 RepID=UPI00404AF3F9
MVTQTIKPPKDNTRDFLNPDITNNELERELEEYTKSAVRNIKFFVVFKSAIISFVALIISFFLDLSTVPVLGNVTIDIARALFPNWQPVQGTISPYSFWWLPVLTYAFFVFLAFLAYYRLKIEIIRTPASATIDRIINSYTSVIDSISTALPLIGAALLLISIKLGEEIFLGLSVPYEVKALTVLAIGKLFEPVIDQLGVKFQNVVNHVEDIREKYFSRIQIENSKNLMKQLNQFTGGNNVSAPNLSLADLEKYKLLIEHSAKLSEIMHKNFAAVLMLAEKINQINAVSSQKIQELSLLANSIQQASNSLSDDKTLTGLKYLESIVVRK